MTTKNKISETQKLRKSLPIQIQNILTKDVLHDLYVTKQQSLGDIAKQYGCSRAYVLKLCRGYGIKVKSKGEARLQAYKQLKFTNIVYYDVDENFFSSWSNEMAYVLGFCFADACLSRAQKAKSENYYRLQITIKDLDLLTRIKELMRSEHPIKTIKNTNGKTIYSFTIGRERITKDLLGLGLTARKSLTIKFPDMPQEHINHFIRGYFDGDGCISFCRDKKSGGGHWRFSVVSGSIDFIHSLKENLIKYAGVDKIEIYRHKSANAYNLSCDRLSNIAKICFFFYDEYTISNRLYLERKYLKFKEAFDKYNNWTPKQKHIATLHYAS